MGLNWLGVDGYRMYEAQTAKKAYKVTEVDHITESRKTDHFIEKNINLNDDAKAPHSQAAYKKTAVILHKVIAEKIMISPVVTVSAKQKLTDVSKLMHSHHYHHFPVIDENSKLIGLIADRDLLRKHPSQSHSDLDNKQNENDIVIDIMSNKVLTASAKTDVQSIALCMIKENIASMPIVNNDHEVIGIITTTDVLRCLVEHAPSDNWG
jgi:CBS-domain-containing membrane protein